MKGILFSFSLVTCFCLQASTTLPVHYAPGNDCLFSARLDTIPVNDTSDGDTFSRVEIEAAFPGGDDAWRRFLEKNLNASIPLEYGAPEGTYTVIIQFVVDKEGTLSGFKAKTKFGYGMEQEVIRLLKKAPKWTPAVQDGRMVKAYRIQPVTFMVIGKRKRH
jgi:protein TonB